MRAILVLFIVVTFGGILVGCGESEEEIYERGYEDGVADVCNEIDNFSNRMFQALEDERIC